ncbi:MAG: helix-turn-helix domain-containing protein, partial [Bacteroidota bacterium]
KKLQQKIRKSGYKIELKDAEMTTAEEQFMEQVMKVMGNHVEDISFSVIQFAQALHLSRPTFNRRLKAMTGQTALGFMRDYRIKRAAQLLAQSDLSVKEVFFQSGIANMKSFRTYFKQAYGLNPKEYQVSIRNNTNEWPDRTNDAPPRKAPNLS